MSDDDILITLVSNDGVLFEVPIKEARLSGEVCNSLPEDDEEAEGEVVNLINVQSDVLVKVLEYCKHFAQEPMNRIETPLSSTRVRDLVQEWYAEFCDSLDDKMLFRLVTAADYMNIQPIIDLTCLQVAVLMKGKSADEIRRMFPPIHVGKSSKDVACSTAENDSERMR